MRKLFHYIKNFWNTPVNNFYDLSEFSIQQLRVNGYICQVSHSRYSLIDYEIASQIKQRTKQLSLLTDKKICDPILFYSKGGKTEVIIQSPDFKKYKGVSICSVEDNFCKRTGIKIALSKLNRIYDNCCGQNCCH